jgi:threonine synthase
VRPNSQNAGLNHRLVCAACGATQGPTARLCFCGGMLEFRYADANGQWDDRFRHSMWRYWRLLPVADPHDAVTLNEGATPLLSSALFPDLSLQWKDESRNPTGSHKDRALALALTEARRRKASVSVVVSAGSTGLSNAAYAARAGMMSVSLMSEGAPDLRVYPLTAYGSHLIEVAAGIDDIIAAACELSGVDGISVASTTRASNPFQAEAPKTIAYEIVEQLGRSPDWLVVPVGGGGTISGIWRGFLDLRQRGAIGELPRLAGVVPETYDALAIALKRRISTEEAFSALPMRDDKPTILNKLSHAHPPDGLEALAAIRASNGVIVAVSDEAAIDGSMQVARTDGLYYEPSTGVVVPALVRLRAYGALRAGDTVVAIGCGSGQRETFVMQAARPARRGRAALRELPSIIRQIRDNGEATENRYAHRET